MVYCLCALLFVDLVVRGPCCPDDIETQLREIVITFTNGLSWEPIGHDLLHKSSITLSVCPPKALDYNLPKIL